MDLKSAIGKKAGPYRDEVTEEKIATFRGAIGASMGKEAPPTYLTRCRHGEFDLFTELGISLSSVLHAEQEYRYEHPIVAGDVLEFETELSQAFEKKGSAGTLTFLIFETHVRGKGVTKSTIVIK